MMNSPWAMLMTFIWPKVKVSPRAMSSSVAPMPRPVKSCDSRFPMVLPAPSFRLTSPALSLPPRVALEVRVRLDRLGRARDLLDEAVGLDHADAGRLVQVLGGAVDGHGALGRRVGEPGSGSPDGRPVRGPCLVGGHGPQVHGGVAGLHGVVDGLVGAVLGLVGRHELGVL